jgi:hypothetical protein
VQDCSPSEIPAFADIFADLSNASTVRKIGEGTFKEAFAVDGAVLSVTPIDGDFPVNDEPQKRASELLGEVEVHLQLSNLAVTPSTGQGARLLHAYQPPVWRLTCAFGDCGSSSDGGFSEHWSPTGSGVCACRNTPAVHRHLGDALCRVP